MKKGLILSRNANGGSAGIGGGYRGSSGCITLSGGSVTATGGSGGGYEGGYESGNYSAGGGIVSISGTNTHVTDKGSRGGKDIGSGANNNLGGYLVVGKTSDTTEPFPLVQFMSEGTNAANPDTSKPQFSNCTIGGNGAGDWKGVYDADGKKNSASPFRLSLRVQRHLATRSHCPLPLQTA